MRSIPLEQKRNKVVGAKLLCSVQRHFIRGGEGPRLGRPFDSRVRAEPQNFEFDGAELEGEPGDDGSTARLTELRGRGGGVDPPEAAAIQAGHRVPGLHRLKVVGARVVQEGAIENVRELSPNAHAVSFLYLECSAEIHVFLRVPLIAVIAVIGGAGAELPLSGVGPCGGV